MDIECRDKSELMATDKEAIIDILKIQHKYRTTDGTELMFEAKDQLKYIIHMEGIHSDLPNNEY